eukprot:IDg15326t1
MHHEARKCASAETMTECMGSLIKYKRTLTAMRLTAFRELRSMRNGSSYENLLPDLRMCVTLHILSPNRRAPRYVPYHSGA